VLAFIQPEGMHPAVIGGEEDFLEAVVIQINHHRVRFNALDDAVILAQRRAGIHRNGFPVESVGRIPKTTAVRVEDVEGIVPAWRIAGMTIVHVPDGDDFRYPIHVHIADHTGAIGEIGAITFLPHSVTFPPAPHFWDQALPYADFAPDLISVQGIGLDLGSVRFVGADIMHIRWDDNLRCSVAIDVSHRSVVVIHPPGIAVVITQLRPAGPDSAGMPMDPGIGLTPHGRCYNDFHVTVAVKVGHSHAAQLTCRRTLGPAQFEVTIPRVDGDIPSAVGRDDFQ